MANKRIVPPPPLTVHLDEDNDPAYNKSFRKALSPDEVVKKGYRGPANPLRAISRVVVFDLDAANCTIRELQAEIANLKARRRPRT